MVSFYRLFRRHPKTQALFDTPKSHKRAQQPLAEQRAYLADTPYLLPEKTRWKISA